MRIKKFINDLDDAKMIHEVIGAIDCPVAITDCNKNLILGVEPEETFKEYPIDAGGERIGYVYGGEKAETLAVLLEYMARCEFEKKSLGKETLEKYKEITLLYNIGDRINASLDIRQVALLVMDEAKRVIKATGGCILLYNAETGKLETVLTFGLGIGKNSALKAFEGLIEVVFREGRSDIIQDVSTYPELRGNYTPQIQSMLFAPLKTMDRIIGVILLASDTLVQYSASDLKLLVSLGSQTAAAVENAKLYDELRDGFYATVQTLAEIAERRDTNAHGHAGRVAKYSLMIGKALGMFPGELARLKLSAMLHDIGKIAISDELLQKNRELTPMEQRLVQKHAEHGAEILEHVKQLRDVIPVIKAHHERFDGRGMPDGLKGTDIPLAARIIAVANTYDVLTTDRPHKGALTQRDALKQIVNNAGSEFDPEVVNALQNLLS
ncbi:MAG: HD domain-containing phosphohydrolase [Solirubrobacterales bacterium]